MDTGEYQSIVRSGNYFVRMIHGEGPDRRWVLIDGPLFDTLQLIGVGGLAILTEQAEPEPCLDFVGVSKVGKVIDSLFDGWCYGDGQGLPAINASGRGV